MPLIIDYKNKFNIVTPTRSWVHFFTHMWTTSQYACWAYPAFCNVHYHTIKRKTHKSDWCFPCPFKCEVALLSDFIDHHTKSLFFRHFTTSLVKTALCILCYIAIFSQFWVLMGLLFKNMSFFLWPQIFLNITSCKSSARRISYSAPESFPKAYIV